VELLPLILVVVLFSVVQSIAGVGLLIFGTPTLLLLGYPFESIIAILLPCSIPLSAAQTWHGRTNLGLLKKTFWICVAPCMVVGLGLVVLKILQINITLWVGILLLFSGIVRAFPRARYMLDTMIQRSGGLYLAATGLVHGLTNMGGGLLTIFVASHAKNKLAIRSNIAYAYLTMGILQILTLLVLKPSAFEPINLLLIPLSVVVYFAIGNRVFLKIPEYIYQRFVTLLIFLYGVLLLSCG